MQTRCDQCDVLINLSYGDYGSRDYGETFLCADCFWKSVQESPPQVITLLYGSESLATMLDDLVEH